MSPLSLFLASFPTLEAAIAAVPTAASIAEFLDNNIRAKMPLPDSSNLLKILQEEMVIWQHYNFGEHDYNDPFMGAVEEMGELSHSLLKMKQGIRGTKEEHMAAASDAVGDTIVFLADMCNQLGIDLHAALEKAWTEVRQRDFKKFPGNGVDK